MFTKGSALVFSIQKLLVVLTLKILLIHWEEGKPEVLEISVSLKNVLFH